MKHSFWVVFFFIAVNFLQPKVNSEQFLLAETGAGSVSSSVPNSPSAPNKITSPLFWAIISNPNDYTLFANGGWDGNWVVGYDSGWVVKLSSPPVSPEIIRAFIGARLGLAKVEPEINDEGKATGWKKAVPGEISMAISGKPAWRKSDVFLLTPAEDIPVAGDNQIPLEEAGESRWFWVEVPLSKVNFSGDNYLVIWSPSANLANKPEAEPKCPIIAGGWEIFPTARAWMAGSNQQPAHAWITSGFAGKIPQELKTPISVYSPAIALKLIPEHLPKLKVNLTSVVPDPIIPNKFTFFADADGENVTSASLEISSDKKNWQRCGRIIYQSPFVFTLRSENLPRKIIKKNIFVRIKAVNWWEDAAYSEVIQLAVVPNQSK
ncbi:MAG: hypothetical protein ABII74_04040 [Elusimicrobiota bacterium]